ncbi:lysine histidine transporter-like 8 [Malania oleifera]|uniref:lysine histidine transporter-like 8 n=1 Tax=Malania oleifera TaxID=397392 RepID=UPI0025ADE7AB|nr:lysine histidine transporter-like 8 [Malania oleifera]
MEETVVEAKRSPGSSGGKPAFMLSAPPFQQSPPSSLVRSPLIQEQQPPGSSSGKPAFMISAPPFQQSPPSSLVRSPLIQEQQPNSSTSTRPKTPLARSPLVGRLSMMMTMSSSGGCSTPLGSPGMKRAAASVRGYLEEIGHLTRVDPQEAWLPITQSRRGNAYYSAFHTLSSGIGFQGLFLPLALPPLGWRWGIICLLMAFVWQLYTLWLLIQLHESLPGTRYSRYLHLSMAAFGEKLGKLFALFPIMYLSGGTCVTLIMIGGGTMKIFFHIVCGPERDADPLTTTEWYLVFACSAVVLAQLPNLNSIAGVSLIGAITAVAYCTLIWAVSVAKGRPAGVSYGPPESQSDAARLCGVLNGLGIIAFAFRGHNLVLEIQGTMPSTLKQPSRVPMWKGVKFAYLLIAFCLFPLALAGYWAYGNLIHSNDGMLDALYKYHSHDTSKALLSLTTLLVVFNSLSSFQIYAMPVFDNLESRYTARKNRPCPWWLRTAIRAFFGCLAFFIAVALPFLRSLAGLIGGVALPVTLAYPCFMSVLIKKPKKYSVSWYLNWTLGWFGMILSILVVIGAVWSIVNPGIELHFFKPH